MYFIKLVISILDKLTSLINKAFCVIATIFLAIMLMVIVSNVLLRYLGHYDYEWAGALTWAEEVTKFLMIWLAYLILPTAHKNGLNISVDFAVALFKGTRFGYGLRLVIEVLICILILKGLGLSWDFMLKGASKTSLALHIKMQYIYTILPISLFVTFLCSVEVLLKLWVSLIEKRDIVYAKSQIVEGGVK